jgi:hypothetical protein
MSRCCPAENIVYRAATFPTESEAQKVLDILAS